MRLALAVSITDDCIESDPLEEAVSTKQRRKCYQRPNYEDSVWARALRDETVADPTSRAGKLFRRRFRTPWPLFCYVSST